MEQPLELKANQGKTIRVSGNTVHISKKGWLFASAREKSIPIRNISSVEVKKPGFITVGFIQFYVAGGIAQDSSYTLSGGAYNAAQDENSAIFADNSSYEIAIKIRDYISNWSGA